MTLNPKHLVIWGLILVSSISQTVQAAPSAFKIADKQQEVNLYLDPDSDPLVKWAVSELQNDIEGITGKRPTLILSSNAKDDGIVIGEVRDPLLAKSSLLNPLLRNKLQGAWESFSLTQQHQSLLVAGSDVRGTVYAIFELSERLGVSPWVWWADVNYQPQSQLSVALPEDGVFESPSVQYRGIFLNDEDWGLQPWAAKTFEKDVGDIGPKTYEKIFQLLLRLKANMIWPAMHSSTQAFYFVDGNQQMAQQYHIVVGTSHGEPMMRNNVGEWDHAKNGDYNYFINSQNINAYWQERVSQLTDDSNLNMFTIGMRGKHDSEMEGAKNIEESVDMLSKVISTQRKMLADTLNKPLTTIPQVLIPYKEVLAIYNNGLQVPDDVTLMWTDDNYGYIRRVSDAAEQQRAGGSGVYYHFSYWGRPHDYLWLNTTQPGLMWYEMTKAYENGAKKVWIANVGDIKPAEYGMEMFLDLAWNIKAIKADNISANLRQWASREFSPEVAEEVSIIMNEYYRLAMLRKPEYMGWGQTEPITPSHIGEFSDTEAQKRMDKYAQLVKSVNKLTKKIPSFRQDAWFELVEYPVESAALMNEKFLYHQLYAHTDKKSLRAKYKHQSIQAYKKMAQLTDYYNTQLAGGKWQHIMSMAPRKLPVFDEPVFNTDKLTPYTEPKVDEQKTIYLQAQQASQEWAPLGYQWQSIENLGYSDGAMTLSPFTITDFNKEQPWLEYSLKVSSPGDYRLELRFLPTHANKFDHKIAVQFDSKSIGTAELNTKGRSEEWKTNVLRNSQIVTFPIKVTNSGEHTVRILLNQTGVVFDQLAFYPQSQPLRYEIPN